MVMVESRCPKCNCHYLGKPALSRKDNLTLICPMCGMNEALEAAKIELKGNMTEEEWNQLKQSITTSIERSIHHE